MPRSKSDISNSAIRIFLQEVGKFYDQSRGYAAFVPNVRQKDELIAYFGGQCCYCATPIDRKALSQDHLIPMNKQHLGLHAWGNVAPCCRSCNNEKQQKPWREFIEAKAGEFAERRASRIEQLVAEKNYDPALNLHQYADNLYDDIGAIAMTLINLRYKQAEGEIQRIVKGAQPGSSQDTAG
ncbi:MAG: HNH endonuclease [Rhizobiaceae bacterium]